MNEEQYRVFADIAEHFPHAQKSLCNSSAIFRNDAYHFDIVRPGMALYGLNPTPEAENPMRAVVSLKAPIMRTRIVYEDARVGYGATWKAPEDTPLATVSVGYADGINWSLSNKGALYWQGIKCPIRGRVSMDMTTVDLSDVPADQRPKPGDYLEVIGPHQSPEVFARDAGSFNYEVLTSLSRRYDREYIGFLHADGQEEAA
jgi:alanine racemase